MANLNIITTADENQDENDVVRTDRNYADIAGGDIELLPIITEDESEADFETTETANAKSRKSDGSSASAGIIYDYVERADIIENYDVGVSGVDESASPAHNENNEKPEGSSSNTSINITSEWGGDFKPTAAVGHLMSDKVIEDEISEEKAGSIYATKKTIAQGMLDIALLTANTSQLRVVLQADEVTAMNTAMIALISFSIALQILVGLGLLYIGTLNKNVHLRRQRANKLNNFVTMFILIITIINVIVSSFGLESVHHHVRAALPAQPITTRSCEDANQMTIPA